MITPLNMRHADWCPMAMSPLAGRDAVCECSDERCQHAYDSGYSDGLKDGVAVLTEFHKHIDQCSQCRNRPFNLCPTGTAIIMMLGSPLGK